MKVITIGFLTQTHWFFNITKEEAIKEWMRIEGETEIPPHVEIQEAEVENYHVVTYSGPY